MPVHILFLTIGLQYGLPLSRKPFGLFIEPFLNAIPYLIIFLRQRIFEALQFDMSCLGDVVRKGQITELSISLEYQSLPPCASHVHHLFLHWRKHIPHLNELPRVEALRMTHKCRIPLVAGTLR